MKRVASMKIPAAEVASLVARGARRRSPPLILGGGLHGEGAQEVLDMDGDLAEEHRREVLEAFRRSLEERRST